MMRIISLSILFLLIAVYTAQSQDYRFKGMVNSWSTVSKGTDWGWQLGGRYIPGIEFSVPLNEDLSIEGKFSANITGSYTIPTEGDNWYGRVKPYRMWTKIRGNQFEIRAGLQKINFGSATILRPLMWFDRIDPRDPLQLTDGVYGILGRYYTLNNINFWLWGLYGNKTKGWELLETKDTNTEIGGRLQFPVPGAEIGLSYHHRTATDLVYPDIGNPYNASIPENRYALDIKADLGIGLWIENVLIHKDDGQTPDTYNIFEYTNMLSVGADYTFSIGNGLKVLYEHLHYKFSSELFGSGQSVQLSAISVTYPFTIFTNMAYMAYIDWQNKNSYHFISVGLTYDRFSYYFMGFINPLEFGIFDFETGPSLYNGKGIQVMVVYNY